MTKDCLALLRLPLEKQKIAELSLQSATFRSPFIVVVLAVIRDALFTEGCGRYAREVVMRLQQRNKNEETMVVRRRW